MAIFKDNSTQPSDRSVWDRKRHKQLVEEAIKKNLSDIIAEESIIGQDKNKIIKIPIRGLKEYQFIYGKNTGGVGSGTGNEKKGDVIGKVNPDGSTGSGQGGAGNQPGDDIYETEVTLEDLVHYLFDDLQLPDMERKKFDYIKSESRKIWGRQRKGIPVRLDKKQSAIERIKRRKQSHRNLDDTANLAQDQPETAPDRIPFREEDLRYKRLKETYSRQSNAVVICIMDTSGSMDQTKKYLARSFYFLLYQFVHWKYENVEVVFIAHTTEAKEVSENDFFHRGESGGTLISSGYNKALEIIEDRYDPAIWNIYAFHCTDGDNWEEDNAKAVEAAQKLLTVTNLFGYGEITINRYNYVTIRQIFAEKITSKNFVSVTINKKEDIWPAFRSILEKQSAGGGEE